MNRFQTFCVLGISSLMAVPMGYSEGNLVTDQYGTTYMMEALPPTLKSQAARQTSTYQEPVSRKVGSTREVHQPAPARINLGPSNNEEELLVNQLLGVVLVANPNDVNFNGWRGVEGVWHDFDDFPSQVGWALQPYIGKPISMKSLDRMVKDVIVAYRKADRPVVDVVIPEHDITSGVIQLVVIESKLGRIRVEGVDVDTEEYIRSQMRVRKGEVFRNTDVMRDLTWLNRSPYRKVDLAYTPGLEFGTTDVIVKPYATDPNSFFIGYEDSGVPFLGEDRLVTGFRLGEFGGPGQSLAYQFSSDWDFEHVRANSVVYSQDLPWRHNFTILASFVDINSQLPFVAPGISSVDSSGFNWQLSARYTIPLDSKETVMPGNVLGSIQRTRDLHFGFDYKSNENNLEFGGGPVAALVGTLLDTQIEIYQFSIGYNEQWQHAGGTSLFDVTGYISPGEFSSRNSDAAFSRARSGSSSSYAYAKATFEHQHRLVHDWSMRFLVSGQLADGNLQASEQFGAGGYDIVRGFDQRIIRGDEAFWGTFELYAPEISFARIFENPDAYGAGSDRLRLLAFFDVATVSNVDLLPLEPSSRSIASVGVGLRYTFNDYFNLRVDYGHPVMSERVPLGTDTTGRFHFGATATF